MGPGSRLRRGFDGLSVQGRRSVSEGGKAGTTEDDYAVTALATSSSSRFSSNDENVESGLVDNVIGLRLP